MYHRGIQGLLPSMSLCKIQHKYNFKKVTKTRLIRSNSNIQNESNKRNSISWENTSHPNTYLHSKRRPKYCRNKIIRIAIILGEN